MSSIGIVSDIIRDILDDRETIRLSKTHIVSAIYQSKSSKQSHRSALDKNELINARDNTNTPIDFNALNLSFERSPSTISFENRPFVIVEGAHWIKQQHTTRFDGNTIDYQGNELHKEEDRIIAEYDMLKKKYPDMKVIEPNIERLKWF